MNRSYFIKSLIWLIAAPKILTEMNKNKDLELEITSNKSKVKEWQWQNNYTLGLIYADENNKY